MVIPTLGCVVNNGRSGQSDMAIIFAFSAQMQDEE